MSEFKANTKREWERRIAEDIGRNHFSPQKTVTAIRNEIADLLDAEAQTLSKQYEALERPGDCTAFAYGSTMATLDELADTIRRLP